jgi:hypothetical protein
MADLEGSMVSVSASSLADDNNEGADADVVRCECRTKCKIGQRRGRVLCPCKHAGLFARFFAYVHQRCVKISEVFVVEIWQGTGCECLPENPFLQKKTLRSVAVDMHLLATEHLHAKDYFRSLLAT